MNKIYSINIAKGISIIFIIFINSINYWLNISDELKYIFGYIVIFSEIFGSMLFIFSYSFETIFTLEKMMGSPPERKRRNEVLKSGILFIWLGLMYNLILNLFNEFSIGIWGWNLILYIGFAKIIIYFTFKLIRWARLVVGLGILFATEFLRELLYINRSINIVFEILYFFIVTPYPKFALLPYASLCIFASTFSELIYQAKILESKKAIMNSIKSTIRYGLIFIILGFLLSLQKQFLH